MGSRHRALLKTPGVRRLLLSSLLARMPLGICSLAVLLFVRGQNGSFLLAGLAVGAFTLAGAAAAPLAGTLVDRFGQVLVLAPCAIGQAVLLIALVVLGDGAPGVLIVLLAGLSGALTPPVSACVRVLWPQVTNDRALLEAAYGLDAVTQETIWILGPLLVAVVVGLASPAAAVLMGATITLLGTGLFASMALPRNWSSSERAHERHFGALSSVRLRALLGSVLAMGSTIGALEVGLPALADHLRSHDMAGVLLALLSVGSMAGGLLYSARSWNLRVAVRHAALLATVVVLIAPLLLAHSLAVGMVLSIFAGLGFAPILSCQYTLVGALAPQGTITEAFTWQTAALVAGIAAGSALGGTLVDIGGAYLAFGLACTGAGIACVLALLGDRTEMASSFS